MANQMGALRHASVLALACAAALVACGGRASSESGASSQGSASAGATSDGESGGRRVGNPGAPSDGNATQGGSSSAGASTSAGGMFGGGSGNTAAGASDAGDAGGARDDAGAAGAMGHAGNGGSAGAPSCSPLVFADPNLEANVRHWLGKPTGELTPEDAQVVTELDATNANITSLAGVECLPLERVYLSGNHVTDLTPLIALKARLKAIDLSGNPLLDLSPLGKLEQLVVLGLNDLPRALDAKDIGTFIHLSNLHSLNLQGDSIETIAPLQLVASLRTLNLYRTQLNEPDSLRTLKQLTVLELSEAISDLEPLTGLTELRYLGLETNGLSDISALAPLVQLHSLDLSENQLTDISVLAGMPQLEDVSLNDNQLVDLSPLGALPNLTNVQLAKNAITSLTPLADSAGLNVLDFVILYKNPFDCQAEHANFEKLKGKGVQILSDCP